MITHRISSERNTINLPRASMLKLINLRYKYFNIDIKQSIQLREIGQEEWNTIELKHSHRCHEDDQLRMIVTSISDSDSGTRDYWIRTNNGRIEIGTENREFMLDKCPSLGFSRSSPDPDGPFSSLRSSPFAYSHVGDKYHELSSLVGKFCCKRGVLTDTNGIINLTRGKQDELPTGNYTFVIDDERLTPWNADLQIIPSDRLSMVRNITRGLITIFVLVVGAMIIWEICTGG